MDYEQFLLAAAKPNRMVSEDADLHQVLSCFYQYDDPSCTRWLHLMARGSGNIPQPFSFQCAAAPEDTVMLIFMTRGALHLDRNEQTVSVSAGQFLIYPCDQPFSFASQVLPCAFETYVITGQSLALYKPLLKHHYVYASKDYPILRFRLDDLSSIPGQLSPSGLIEMNRCLIDILSVFAILAAPEQSALSTRTLPAYLIAMHNFIQTDCSGEFSLSECEELYSVSRYRLCREYKEAYGISPLQDYNACRMRQAEKLLTSDLQIQEVSRQVGYENVNHFIHLFRKATGMTPGKFRQMERAGKF